MMGSTCSTDAIIMTESTSATTIKPFSQLSESYSREESKTEQHFTYIGSLEKLPEKPDDVIRDLEERQLPVIKEALQSSDPADTLMSFMKNGADEFKERTGRNMTYAEMRAAWG